MPALHTVAAINLLLFSLGAAQLANFGDLVRLATLNTNSESRSDRSLANSYPFNLGERQHHHGHNPNSARNYGASLHSHEVASQPQSDLGVIAARRRQNPAPAASAASALQLGGLQGYSQLQGVEVQQRVAATRRDSLPLHRSVQQHLEARPQQPLQASGFQFNSLQYQQPAVQHSQYQQPSVQHSQYQQQAQPFIGPAVAPAGYSGSVQQAHNSLTNYAPAPAPAPAYGSRYQAEAAPVITVTDDAVIAVAAPSAPSAPPPAVPVAVPAGLCPAPARLPHQCGGAVNTCWSVGVADVDCPGHSLCCFDGCSNYCVGQARAVARPAIVIPEQRVNPAQARQPLPGLEVVAAARERCVDKIEQVEEIEYDEVEECHHSYDKQCHTTYTTEYESQQEEECDDNYKKECSITYRPHATNVTVAVCMTPLIKDCNLSGPEVCRTEYIAECWTRNEPHQVVDDVPKCRTEYEEKCEYTQSGYVTDQKCSKWPREVCTIAKEFRSKANPVSKCEKIPQRLCGPAGCGFVPGPEQCHDEVKTVVQDLPQEECDLTPQRQCSHVTKLVPKLTPAEECVDVPKEVCQKSKGDPRKVLKPITKKWCYVPSEESGLH